MDVSVAVRRLGYRCAYRMLQIVWWLTRPALTGVKCIVVREDQVLLVRHTYGPRVWDLPGGITHRGEAPAGTAAREMTEELGLRRDDWVALGVIRGRMAFRRDTIYIFGVGLSDQTPLAADPVELAMTDWFPRATLPQPLAPYAAAILAQAPVERLDGLADV